jgi:hypothetical protein
MSEEHARRAGLNEALFRQVNEQIQDLNRSFGADQETMSVVCECADGDCTERFDVPGPVYDSIRSDPLRYLVVPGHEVPDLERIVEHGTGYDVVEKRPGTPAEVSKETDPRT